MFRKHYLTEPAQMRFAFFKLKAHLAVLPTAVPPRQVLQLQHAEDQRNGGNGQHEHNKDIFLCWPGDITVHRMGARPGLKHREVGESVRTELCFTLDNEELSVFTLQTYRGLRKIPYIKYWRVRNTTCGGAAIISSGRGHTFGLQHSCSFTAGHTSMTLRISILST